MANVILGLLLLSPMSLYDLLQAFGAGVSLVYSASSGSIKRALDDLVARGLVEVDQVRPGARGRKVHRVNDAGRQAFETWMRSELTEPDSERAVLSRLYFLGLLDDAGRPAFAENPRSVPKWPRLAGCQSHSRCRFLSDLPAPGGRSHATRGSRDPVSPGSTPPAAWPS